MKQKLQFTVFITKKITKKISDEDEWCFGVFQSKIFCLDINFTFTFLLVLSLNFFLTRLKQIKAMYTKTQLIFFFYVNLNLISFQRRVKFISRKFKP